jgi:hypothetical protein
VRGIGSAISLLVQSGCRAIEGICNRLTLRIDPIGCFATKVCYLLFHFRGPVFHFLLHSCGSACAFAVPANRVVIELIIHLDSSFVTFTEVRQLFISRE